MTDDPNTSSPPHSDSEGGEQNEASAHSEKPNASQPSRKELQERLDELRAEVTRLRAQQVRRSSQSNWFRRHPVLSVALIAGLGAAAGYGTAKLVRPRPPRSLSSQAKERLDRLAQEASQIATRLQNDWGEEAAKRGGELRRRAAKLGRQLANEAQSASKRAQSAGAGASSSLRKATASAAQRVRDASTSVAEEAETAVEESGAVLADAADAAADKNGRSVTQTLLTLGGVVAGGYLASKVRQWV